MRLFVSYARVDKPYCIQIVDLLDVHEVWYDQRLYVGLHWWKEILRRLEWCDGFIYLLSPDSVMSDYCQREYDIARTMNRHIFPVLIHEQTPIPAALAEYQYADLSTGLTVEAVKVLLNSIYLAETRGEALHSTAFPTRGYPPLEPEPVVQTVDHARAVSKAVAAMENGEFDRAVFLLKQAKAEGYRSRFINIDAVLEEAEKSLERQSTMREVERDYRQIAELIGYKRTRHLGCEAFEAFQRAYPDYDPDGLAQQCGKPRPMLTRPPQVLALPAPRPSALPLLEWCDIPKGTVKLNRGKREKALDRTVEPFAISRYPVTNAQYQMFLDDPNGYANLDWWQYSRYAREWRISRPNPMPSAFRGDERPREMLSWYDAMAFCHWLSKRLGAPITLPTIQQRQRAIQGDDERGYPWGDKFDKARCNTRESDLRMTTLVTRYTNGISPYGVYDLVGNVWEWCLDATPDAEQRGDDRRAVHGGSFVGNCDRTQIDFCYFLPAYSLHASIGFRLVRT